MSDALDLMKDRLNARVQQLMRAGRLFGEASRQARIELGFTVVASDDFALPRETIAHLRGHPPIPLTGQRRAL